MLAIYQYNLNENQWQHHCDDKTAIAMFIPLSKLKIEKQKNYSSKKGKKSLAGFTPVSDTWNF